MYKYQGSCQCENVSVNLRLPAKLEEYSARQCDCDFCMARGLYYLSDPKGELSIKSATLLDSKQQGSMQAKFLVCSNCQDIICASYAEADFSIGALNATLLVSYNLINSYVIVSPKKLSASEKLKRWQQMWMPINFSH